MEIRLYPNNTIQHNPATDVEKLMTQSHTQHQLLQSDCKSLEREKKENRLGMRGSSPQTVIYPVGQDQPDVASQCKQKLKNRSSSRSCKSKKDGSDASRKHNGKVVQTNTFDAFARRFLNVFIFERFRRESLDTRQSQENRAASNRRPPRTLLYGASNADEHFRQLEWAIETARGKCGLDGLKAIGFQYNVLTCTEHRHLEQGQSVDRSDTILKYDIGVVGQSIDFPLYESYNERGKVGDEISEVEGVTDVIPKYRHRLVHVASNTLITTDNRVSFIADGNMYEEVARLCQEHAQDLIQREGSLHWVSICEDAQKGRPIRALVHKDYKDRLSSQQPNVCVESKGNEQCPVLPNTLLITTGRGKVRAGIFSRQHLIVSGIEAGSCLESVREAQKRGMRVIILDPNARGERYGMSTYEQSLQTIFRGKISEDSIPESSFNQERVQNPSLYVFSHSASGAQLARHLMDNGSYLMHYLRAVAFTDSSHNIQWLKNHHELSFFLQSPSSMCVRSANEYRDYGWEKHRPGDICVTDDSWKHRFGDVRTIWAGTKDHSLSNWTAHAYIWEHFDNHLGPKDGTKPKSST